MQQTFPEVILEPREKKAFCKSNPFFLFLFFLSLSLSFSFSFYTFNKHIDVEKVTQSTCCEPHSLQVLQVLQELQISQVHRHQKQFSCDVNCRQLQSSLKCRIICCCFFSGEQFLKTQLKTGYSIRLRGYSQIRTEHYRKRCFFPSDFHSLGNSIRSSKWLPTDSCEALPPNH